MNYVHIKLADETELVATLQDEGRDYIKVLLPLQVNSFDHDGQSCFSLTPYTYYSEEATINRRYVLLTGRPNAQLEGVYERTVAYMTSQRERITTMFAPDEDDFVYDDEELASGEDSPPLNYENLTEEETRVLVEAEMAEEAGELDDEEVSEDEAFEGHEVVSRTYH